MKLRIYPEEALFLSLSNKGNVIPVCLEVLADTETPVSALAKMTDDSGTIFLLESVEGGERWGRYSFLGTSARAQFLVFQEFVEIRQNDEKIRLPHEGDPLKILREAMGRYRPVALAKLPRFWGGMVGYLTYEMVSFFERVPNRLPENKPLAHFILTDHLLIFDNLRHTLTIVVHAFLESGSSPEAEYRKALQRLEDLLSQLYSQMQWKHTEQKSYSTLQAVESPESFRDKVKRIKKYIQEGEVIQTVISQSFVTDSYPNPINIYRAQRYINPSPYMYFLRLGDLFLIGSSPETMVRLENGVVTLRPIAGTRPRGSTEQEDRQLADELLKDPKEQAEHLMLVDLGRNDLGRIAEVGSVQVTDLMIVERYSHVMHLVSNINCDLQEGLDAWDVIKATFPAGTLTGAPKIRAMGIIAELEEQPRGPYGGAVGYVSFDGNMDLAITIRTACIEGGRLIVRAGAGIVADSDPEKERVETVNKAMALQRAVELAASSRREPY